MYSFYDMYDSTVQGVSYISEAIFFSPDTKKIYYDSPLEGKRVEISDFITVSTEDERLALLAPVAGKIYLVTDSGCFYLYTNSNWIRLSSGGRFDIDNVSLINSTLDSSTGYYLQSIVITDTRIKTGYTAEFVPDLAVSDLVVDSSISIEVSSGSVSISVSATCQAPIFGTVKFNNG